MDESRGMTGSDALAVTAAIDGNRNGYGYGYPMMPAYGNNGFFGGMDGAFWIFALLMLNNNGWGGLGGGCNTGLVTQADLAASQNAQTAQLTMSGIQSQIADGQLTTVQAINDQTNSLMQQNNTNLVNAIQGFNALSGQVTNQTNVLSQQLQALSAKLDQCCCDIKTQMLQDRLTDAEATIVAQRGEISNQQQTQNILNAMGRWIAWAGTGTQGGVAAASA